MRAKSLKSSQILRAHMPYFCRPGHICSLLQPDVHNLIFEGTRINGTSNTIMMLAEDADIEGSDLGDGSLQHNSTLTILNVSYTDNGDGYYCNAPNSTEANCSESSTSYLTGMCVS